MKIQCLDIDFAVCKVADFSCVRMECEFCFAAGTDEEFSLVCPENELPTNVIKAEKGWRGFRVEGTLDFGLVGIIADISACLKNENIPLFVISTFNTDYILVKKEFEKRAIYTLKSHGYDMTHRSKTKADMIP